MSPPKKNEPTDGPGVLSNLPRTRPQRASPRRAAARKATAAAATATPTAAPPAPAKAKRPRSTAKRAAGPPNREPVPRQGFESDGERANGPVQPPGGAELVAGAAELIGELAKAGISTGERLFKDVLSRLPLS
ncbi:MAG TPA: hypothetical protein VK680_01845 [Solirubrobacteraceae bacterium]|jgi:hypothetical protein|nr:hypothetical protein [Solirubrobacteraceae bacterium]